MRALVVEDDAISLAIAVERVLSVINHPALTPVPTAPPSVLGLANVRGDIVPVLDTGLLLGVQPVTGATFVLVVDTGRGPAGLALPVMPVTAEVDEGRLTDPDALVDQ